MSAEKSPGACDDRTGPQRPEDTIVDEWDGIRPPPPPELEPVTVDAKATALVILDVQKRNCNAESRPRCVASLPRIRSLLAEARDRAMPVVFTLTRGADAADIRPEVAPAAGEPVVSAGVDKFFGTDLADILRRRGVREVILVGTSAHGAVLHTATGAALRGLGVIVPVDAVSAGQAYAEQYTAWHLVNAPGTRRQTRLTRVGLMRF